MVMKIVLSSKNLFRQIFVSNNSDLEGVKSQTKFYFWMDFLSYKPDLLGVAAKCHCYFMGFQPYNLRDTFIRALVFFGE